MYGIETAKVVLEKSQGLEILVSMLESLAAAWYSVDAPTRLLQGFGNLSHMIRCSEILNRKPRGHNARSISDSMDDITNAET